MVYTTRIPCKIQNINFIGEDRFAELNTNALDCTIKAVGGTVNIKITSDDKYNIFTLSDGERFDYSGSIYVSGAEGTQLQVIYFTTF